jgi:hypothetical protein
MDRVHVHLCICHFRVAFSNVGIDIHGKSVDVITFDFRRGKVIIIEVVVVTINGRALIR